MTPPPQPQKDWEKEFDKEFPNDRSVFVDNDPNNLRRDAIKSFISAQIEAAERRGREEGKMIAGRKDITAVLFDQEN